MAFSGLLMIGIYVVVIALLVAAGAGVVAIAVALAVLVLAHYLGTERLILSALGARPVAADDAGDLELVMERVCVVAERPMVRLAVIDSAAPNAFTVARSPLNATICVTSSLLELLEEAELEAVLAHELAHVASRDVVLVTLGSVWAALGAHLVALDRHLPHRRGHEEQPWGLVLILAGLLFVVSYVTIQSLSRRRQLAADRAAFLLMRGSDAVGAALASISAAVGELPEEVRRTVCGELTALGLIPVDAPDTVATMFPTHPPLELRRAQLESVSRELFAAAEAAGPRPTAPPHSRAR